MECNIFHSISNEDKIIGRYPNGFEIFGDEFWANFSSETGAPLDLCDTEVSKSYSPRDFHTNARFEMMSTSTI